MKSLGLLITQSTLLISVFGSVVGYTAVHATETVNADESAEPQLILTIGSSAMYEAEFRYWLGYMEKYYQANHGDEITDWTVKQNGLPLREYFLKSATDYACKDRAVAAKALELGVTVSSSELAEIQTARASNISIYGSESEYRRIVASMYESEAVFDHLISMKYLGKNLFAHLYGAKGEQCSDQCVSAYIEHERFMAAKYIFLSNLNSEGKRLTVTQRQQHNQLLQNILRQLDASNDAQTLFEQLMNLHSQDASLANYPDGRLFASGSMGQAFEQAYLKLANNQYSRIVNTEAGDYLILRMPIFPDMAADAESNTLRYWAAYQYQFKNQVESWCAQLPIKREAAYYRMYP